jgi:hypothetical protein
MNYEQAFAIARLDTFLEVEIGSRLEAITVEKVVWTQEARSRRSCDSTNRTRKRVLFTSGRPHVRSNDDPRSPPPENA